MLVILRGGSKSKSIPDGENSVYSSFGWANVYDFGKKNLQYGKRKEDGLLKESGRNISWPK